MDADDIRPKVGHDTEMTERRIDSEIQGRAEGADKSVQDEITETGIELWNSAFYVHR